MQFFLLWHSPRSIWAPRLVSTLFPFPWFYHIGTPSSERYKTLKSVYHAHFGSIYALTIRPWISLWYCRGDVGGGASGDGHTAPREYYGAGVDDNRSTG